MSVCYVTAFYDLQRENWPTFSRTIDQYFLYFEPFMGLFSRGNNRHRMILFMDKRYSERARKLIEKYAKNARIDIVEIDKDFMLENIPVWRTLRTEREIMESESFKEKVGDRIRFPEHRIPEYTLINHAKIDFVNYAMNFDNSQYFTWVDFGYFAYPKNVPKNLLDIDKLDKERVNYTLINKLDDNDKNIDYTLKYAPEKFGGFFFFGSRAVLKEYQRLYHEILEIWQTKLRIADDDQHLAMRCYFHKPEMFALHYTGAWHAALKYFQFEPLNLERLLDNEELVKIANANSSDLCVIMNNEGSDKGSGHHNYTKLYDKMFKHRRDEPLTILEIGIGSVNPGVVSNMCGMVSYQPGASIRGWKKYFPKAKIYCCDIDHDTMILGQDRVISFVMDQRNTASVYKTYSGILKDVTFDIIIDDGLHHFPTNYTVLEILQNKLNKGGCYIIEDILDYNEDLVKLGGDWCYVTLPNPKNNVDNNLFIVWK
jgi:hypothetical protein